MVAATVAALRYSSNMMLPLAAWLLLVPCVQRSTATVAAAPAAPVTAAPATIRLTYHARLGVLTVQQQDDAEVAAPSIGSTTGSSRRRRHHYCGDNHQAHRSSTGLSVLINARMIAECTSSTFCAVRILSSADDDTNPSVAVYQTCSDGHMILLHTQESDDPILRSAAAVAATVRVVTAVPLSRRPRMLLYNTVEHTQFALSAISWQHTANNLIPTIENIVQSNGSLRCTAAASGDRCTKCSSATNSTACCLLSACGVYHATPTIRGMPSYYCWWRHRNGSSNKLARELVPPDCENITANARYLAQLWHTSGIDVVVPDTTNRLYVEDPDADLLNIRPVEVLLEELSKLRKQSVPTPQMAVWTVAGHNTTMFRGMLPLLNRPEFSELWLRNSLGKAIYFIHGPPGCRPWPVGGVDPAGHHCDVNTISEIEANGGAHNVRNALVCRTPLRLTITS
jgi:hypothetical protein